MNKGRMLIFLVVILLISNLGLIAFITLRKPPHPPRPREVVIERLSFSKDQIAKYDQLISRHQHDVYEEENKLLDSKNKLYALLLTDPGSGQVDSLTLLIGQYQTKIEKIHFIHFSEIQDLCTAEQKEKFKSLVNDLSEIFFRRQMKKPDQ